ncbi:hypothetical protein F7725_005988, partial [Dissostichus mawsoni]
MCRNEPLDVSIDLQPLLHGDEQFDPVHHQLGQTHLAQAEEPQSLQDVLPAVVFGEVLQFELHSDPQTCPHVGWRAADPAQLLLPGERVFEFPVKILQLETERGANSCLKGPG